MYICIPLEEVQALLKSAELATLQAEVIGKLGSRLLPEDFATPYQRELSYAGIPVSVIYELFRNERDLLVRFSLLCQRASQDPAEIDGEFPPGEEQDPSERSELVEFLGHSNGFIITHAIDLILSRRGKADLLSYQKWRRIPFASRYCDELLHHLKIASQPR